MSIYTKTNGGWTEIGASESGDGLSAGGLQLVHSEAFTAVGGINLNDVFTTDYANYRVVVRFTDFSADTNVNVRMRTSGGSNSSNLYQQQSFYYVSGTAVGSLDSSKNTLMLATKVSAPNWKHNYIVMDVFGPWQPTPTLISWRASLSISSVTVAAPVVGHCTFNGTTGFDGLAVYVTNGLETGDISVYGYQNS
jgi:hypothetical protein